MPPLKFNIIVNDDGSVVVNKFGKNAQKAYLSADKAAGKYSGTLDKIGKLMPAALSVGAIGYAIKKWSDLAAVQARAEATLTAVLRATGRGGADLTQQLGQLASKLQSMTTVGDEAIMGVMTRLAGFSGIATADLERVTVAVMDMAAATGQSMDSIASAIGRASGGQTGGLGRLGVLIEQGASLEQILTAIESRSKGAAAALAGTMGGAVTQMRNQLGDLQEQLGGFFLTFGDQLSQGMTGALSALQQTIAGIDFRPWAAATAEVFLALGRSVVTVIGWIQESFAGIRGAAGMVELGIAKVSGAFAAWNSQMAETKERRAEARRELEENAILQEQRREAMVQWAASRDRFWKEREALVAGMTTIGRDLPMPAAIVAPPAAAPAARRRAAGGAGAASAAAAQADYTSALLETDEAYRRLIADLQWEITLQGQSEAVQRAVTEARQAGVIVGGEQYQQILQMTMALSRMDEQAAVIPDHVRLTADAFERLKGAIEDSLTSFSLDLIMGRLKSFRDFLSRLAEQIASIFLRLGITMAVQRGFSALGIGASVGHQGSTGWTTRTVDPTIFAGAPRLHRGLAPDEFPAILQRGERVIPRREAQRGGAVRVVVVPDDSYIQRYLPSAIGDTVIATLSSRPAQARAALGV